MSVTSGEICSQESEKGHWHIPISSEHEYDTERPWLCIMRAKSRVTKPDTKARSDGNLRVESIA